MATVYAGHPVSVWEHVVWHSIHLVFVGALVLTLIVVFALLCRWYVGVERRRKGGGGPVVLSPTGYPLGQPATRG